MNWKTTLGLALLVSAVFAYVQLYERHQPGTRGLAEQSGRVLAKFDRARVESLRITQRDAKIEIVRDRSQAQDQPGALTRWRLQAPVADRADASVVDALLAELETLRREGVVAVPGAKSDPGKLAPFGLQNPRVRLGIVGRAGERDGPAAELLLGNDTPVEGRTYAAIAGREEVYAVPGTLRKQLERGVGEFRDRQFTDLPPAEIARLSIKNATGTLELNKEGDHWRMLKPQAARASDAKLTEILGRLTDLRVETFLPEEKTAEANAGNLGLAEPRGTLTLATADTPPRTAELLLGKPIEPPKDKPAADRATPPPPPTIYARSPGRAGVLAVPRSVEDFLNLKPEELRDRQFARVNPDTVDRIRIRPGAREFTLSRARAPGKGWTLREGNGPEQPANAAEADRLLTRLPAEGVTAFIADTSSDLPRYGLDQPVLRVSFLSVASETTAENAAGEKALATLEFGKPENNLVFARLAEEPFIVSVDKAVPDSVATDPLAWQVPEIFKADPGRVRAVSVKRQDGAETSVERGDAAPTAAAGAGGTPAAWKLAGAAAATGTLDAVRAQSLVNTLARLRAVRWIGATRPEHGLDNPAATLAFQTSTPGDGGKLLLGARTPEGMWYARVDGRPGTFLVNAPDHTTLTQQLVAPAAPAAPPIPPPPPAR